jgi:hypothetical protein
LYGDPDALDRLAATLNAHADEVRRHAADHVKAAQTAHWVSPSADSFRSRVGHDRVRVDRDADQLDDAAAALRAHAQHVRDVLTEIGRIERAATDWFEREARNLREKAANLVDTAKEGLSHLWPDAPGANWPVTPNNLPGPGDCSWLEVGQFLRGQGISL